MFSTLSKQQEKLLQTSPLFDSLTPEQIRPVLYCLQAEVRRAAANHHSAARVLSGRLPL